MKSRKFLIVKLENELIIFFVKKGIYENSVLSLLSELKMWREAYSYHLPLSGIKYDFKDFKEKMEKILPILFQTSELLSYLTHYAWKKE